MMSPLHTPFSGRLRTFSLLRSGTPKSPIGLKWWVIETGVLIVSETLLSFEPIFEVTWSSYPSPPGLCTFFPLPRNVVNFVSFICQHFGPFPLGVVAPDDDRTASKPCKLDSVIVSKISMSGRFSKPEVKLTSTVPDFDS